MSERAERLAAARARLVYLVNQSAHCDGACHQAITEFVYSADALAAELEAVEERERALTEALERIADGEAGRMSEQHMRQIAYAALARGGTPATEETT